MYDIHTWPFWIFFLPFAIFAIVGRYRIRKLDSPQKEFSSFAGSLIFVGLAAILLFLSFPDFSCGSRVPTESENLRDLVSVIAAQDRCVTDFLVDMRTFRSAVDVAFIFFLVGFLPSFYNFARAITPKDKNRFSLLDYESN